MKNSHLYSLLLIGYFCRSHLAQAAGNLLFDNSAVSYECYNGETSVASDNIQSSDMMDLTGSSYEQSSDAASFCLAPTFCNGYDFDKYVLVIDLTTPVSARSIMPVLS